MTVRREDILTFDTSCFVEGYCKMVADARERDASGAGADDETPTEEEAVAAAAEGDWSKAALRDARGHAPRYAYDATPSESSLSAFELVSAVDLVTRVFSMDCSVDRTGGGTPSFYVGMDGCSDYGSALRSGVDGIRTGVATNADEISAFVSKCGLSPDGYAAALHAEKGYKWWRASPCGGASSTDRWFSLDPYSTSMTFDYVYRAQMGTWGHAKAFSPVYFKGGSFYGGFPVNRGWLVDVAFQLVSADPGTAFGNASPDWPYGSEFRFSSYPVSDVPAYSAMSFPVLSTLSVTTYSYTGEGTSSETVRTLSYAGKTYSYDSSQGVYVGFSSTFAADPAVARSMIAAVAGYPAAYFCPSETFGWLRKLYDTERLPLGEGRAFLDFAVSQCRRVSGIHYGGSARLRSVSESVLRIDYVYEGSVSQYGRYSYAAGSYVDPTAVGWGEWTRNGYSASTDHRPEAVVEQPSQVFAVLEVYCKGGNPGYVPSSGSGGEQVCSPSTDRVAFSAMDVTYAAHRRRGYSSTDEWYETYDDGGVTRRRTVKYQYGSGGCKASPSTAQNLVPVTVRLEFAGYYTFRSHGLVKGEWDGTYGGVASGADIACAVGNGYLKELPEFSSSFGGGLAYAVFVGELSSVVEAVSGALYAEEPDEPHYESTDSKSSTKNTCVRYDCLSCATDVYFAVRG